MGKLINMGDLANWCTAQKEAGKKLVVTNGCFDLLHVGHVRYLEQAKALGDILLVGLNADQSVKQLKGPERPINKEEDRAEVIAALASVDAVAIFPEVRATNFLRIAQPNVYVKGGDYTIEQLDADEVAAVRVCGGEIKILPMVAGKSTTNLIRKMQQ